jgi:mannose-6-phosphate isomerase
MNLLENTIQTYAWGSRSAIADISGRASPSKEPEAELWMGAHPSAPSKVREAQGSRSLLDLIAHDPAGTLGSSVVDRFGPRLPFLLKILAAETPLSLQAHPTIEQAREGFAREQAEGVALGASHRNYKDANHKPELICALTPFHALVGFRPVDRTLRLLDGLSVEALSPYSTLLRNQGLRPFFEALMTLDAERKRRLAEDVLAACERGDGSEFRDELAWGVRIGKLYPGDVGIVVALSLNLVLLEPGQAVYLPAGNLHAYLSGTGVEIMANSDNVLRGGLTPKHVDVPELLKILDFHAATAKVQEAQPTDSELVFVTPAPDFRLSYIDLEGSVAPHRRDTPEILLVTKGAARLRSPAGDVALTSGQSAFVRADDPSYVLEGSGQIFRATVG